MNTDADFDRVLDAALDRLLAGEALAVVLADHAAHAAALAPLLASAQAARQTLRGPVPVPDLAPGRLRFLAAAHRVRPSPSIAAAWRTAWAGLALALVLMVGAGAASAQALPGEALYPVKRAVEAVQLALTFDPAARDQMTANLAARRRAEAARVVDLRREAALAFTGVVEGVTPGRLLISGLTVLSDRAADFAPGDVLAVEARATRTGDLVATRLTRLAAGTPPTAPPTLTARAPTATLTQRPRPTPTSPAPRATFLPTTARPVTVPPSATQLPTESVTARPGLASPSPTPPATVRPPDATSAPTATPAERPSQRPPQRP